MTASLDAILESAKARRIMPVLIAAGAIAAFLLIAPALAEPRGPDLQPLIEGKVTDAQAQTLDMTKQLNAYLISMTTFMFGALGWYLSKYRPAASLVVRSVFFSTVGFLVLAFWYASQAYAELTSELAQNALGLRPGSSRILYWVELEFGACAIAAVLVLLVFADAVTHPERRAASDAV